jgi:hypothetical protein
MSADDFQAATDLEPIRGEALPVLFAEAVWFDVKGDHKKSDQLFERATAAAKDQGMETILTEILLERAQVAHRLGLASQAAELAREAKAIAEKNGFVRAQQRCGKRGSAKRGCAPSPPGTARWVPSRLRADSGATRGVEPGPLLCPIGKGGRLQIRRLTDKSVRYIVAARPDTGLVKMRHRAS